MTGVNDKGRKEREAEEYKEDKGEQSSLRNDLEAHGISVLFGDAQATQVIASCNY